MSGRFTTSQELNTACSSMPSRIRSTACNLASMSPPRKYKSSLHGPANTINYDDYIGSKYKIGEWLKVEDPKTGNAAERNIFYRSKADKDLHYASEDPNDENSLYQDTSVEALQSRGVKFLSCHTALEEQARALVGRLKLSSSPEDVVKDFMAHKLPGVLIVPSMVASLALLQNRGHYAYMRS